jgi:hypothetical protein
VVQTFLKRSGLQVLVHPPYSPDISPCDFFLFGVLKKWLTGRKFASVDDAKEQVRMFLTDLDPKKLKASIDAWPDRCSKVIARKGQYIL